MEFRGELRPTSDVSLQVVFRVTTGSQGSTLGPGQVGAGEEEPQTKETWREAAERRAGRKGSRELLEESLLQRRV